MISVIIPVFNVEKTLSQCLDSVINQTYKNLEIICVNDCSGDSSLDILKEYAKKDTRIKILQNEKNLGLGLTRNHGMRYANGDYIHFLDSDDWMELDAYEKLSQKLDENPDIINFLWNNIDVKNKITRPEKSVIKNTDGNFSQNNEIIKNWGVSVWHRLYKREFLEQNNLIFNDYRCMEDVEFIYKVLILAKNIKFLDENLINYRINNSNSLIGKANRYYNCIVETYKTIYEFSKQLDNKSRDVILANLLNSTLYKIIGSFVSGFMTFDELKYFIENIDYNVFLNDKKTYKWYGFYKEIMQSPKFMIKLRYKTKLFLRNNFYDLYEKLKGIKN